MEDFGKGGAFGTRDRRYGNVDFASLLNDNDRGGGLSRKKVGGEEDDGEDEFHRERQEHGGQSASEILHSTNVIIQKLLTELYSKKDTKTLN